MDLGLAGKTIVATGASKGLGRAIAEVLVAEGARVVIVSRDPTSAVAELGERAVGCAADLSTAGGVDAVVAAAAELGRVDGLLVNSGGPPPGQALSLTDAEWASAFQLLVALPLRMLRGLAPLFNDGSSVLFVTSASVRMPLADLDASNVLRPGVAALVKTLSRQLGPGTRVNSIAPGRIDTERVRMLDELRSSAEGITVDAQRLRNWSAIPLGRYGETAEFGRVGAFLLSPAASYVSGAAIQVDGGYVTSVP